MARQAVAEIQSRGRTPVFCGGTGLYFKAFHEGLGAAPPADDTVRAELEATPLDALLRELAERDPVAHEKIDRRNPRRVLRALEVIRLTGKPFSDQRGSWKESQTSDCRLFGFVRASEDLRTRIDQRVDQMFRDGLVAETEQLLNRGLAENKTARQALGY